jgi:hypothetical protein
MPRERERAAGKLPCREALQIPSAKFQAPINFQYSKSKFQTDAELPRPLRGHPFTEGESLSGRNMEQAGLERELIPLP